MKNNKLIINKNSDDITVEDITILIKKNTNPLNVVLKAIKTQLGNKCTINKVNPEILKEYFFGTDIVFKIKYNNTPIYCYSVTDIKNCKKQYCSCFVGI